MENAISQNNDFDYFDVWKAAIEERTGVQITPDRERALALLLDRRMKELDSHDIDQYMSDALDVAKGAQEWSGLIDNLLVKETSFFRHRPSMDYVQSWVTDAISDNSFNGPRWIWSLGCSTGEEAYSLAIMVEQAIKAAGVQRRYGIIGTDISREAIFQARRGIYRESKMAMVDKSTNRDYFDPIGKGLWRVKADLRRRVCFLTSNILTDGSPLIRRKMHLIYCQNMLVYFRRWKRREIINQLRRHLDEQGCLLLGLGELNNWVPGGFSRVTQRNIQAYIKDETVEQGVAR
jgi:chemotaxis protein methyltransferase CheR/type IV pilus assembly protein PilK